MMHQNLYEKLIIRWFSYIYMVNLNLFESKNVEIKMSKTKMSKIKMSDGKNVE